MAEKKSHPENLRSRAERMLAENASPTSHPARADLEKLVNELNVYRIELELQNEELRSSQEKLQESRSNYFELYNLAPVAFLTISPISPHRVLGANSAACRLLGVNRTKIVGMSPSSFAAAKDISALSDFLKRLEGDEELSTEIRMKRKSPPLSFSARIQARRASGKSGKARILVALSDVSDLVRAREVLQHDRDALEGSVLRRTEELEAANRELAQKNLELQDFAFIASHDLREPIRKVLTFSSLIEERYKDRLDEAARNYLDRMRNAADRMESMLASLLEYSHLETRARQVEKVSLNEVFNQIQSNLEEEIARRKGRLKIGDLPAIEAEPQQMVQLFQNLIANALKYSERPPEISVYAEDGRRQRSTIYVVDNGIGFELKYLDKIFSPFERLHGRETYEGTGMGLTICRKIAERHKGGITATSTPGEGSVFIVTLPYKQ